jgi:hypothetical protein
MLESGFETSAETAFTQPSSSRTYASSRDESGNLGHGQRADLPVATHVQRGPRTHAIVDGAASDWSTYASSISRSVMFR